MKECQGNVSWFGQYASLLKEKRGRTIKSDDKAEVDVISCQDWDVTYHRGQTQRKATYRVHVLQSSTDVFEAEIFPPTFYRTLKDLLLN